MPPKKAKKAKCVDVVVTQRLRLRPSTGSKNIATVCNSKKTVKYVTHKGKPGKGEVKVTKKDLVKLVKASDIKRKPRARKSSKKKPCKAGSTRDRKTKRCRKKKTAAKKPRVTKSLTGLGTHTRF